MNLSDEQIDGRQFAENTTASLRVFGFKGGQILTMLEARERAKVCIWLVVQDISDFIFTFLSTLLLIVFPLCLCY